MNNKHHIELKDSKNKLNLELNEEEYEVLVEGINKYPREDNLAI